MVQTIYVIVKAHGGTLMFENIKGISTTFMINFME